MYFKEPYKTNLVAALRSGEYKQGHGALKKGDEYCCLGVACDILPKGLGEWEDANVVGTELHRFHDEVVQLPDEAIEEIFIEGESADGTELYELAVGTFTRDQKEKLVKYLQNNESRLEPMVYDLMKYDSNCALASNCSLADFNDAGIPFSTIADIIEKFC